MQFAETHAMTLRELEKLASDLFGRDLKDVRNRARQLQVNGLLPVSKGRAVAHMTPADAATLAVALMCEQAKDAGEYVSKVLNFQREEGGGPLRNFLAVWLDRSTSRKRIKKITALRVSVWPGGGEAEAVVSSVFAPFEIRFSGGAPGGDKPPICTTVELDGALLIKLCHPKGPQCLT